MVLSTKKGRKIQRQMHCLEEMLKKTIREKTVLQLLV